MVSKVLSVYGTANYTDSYGRFVEVPLIRLQGKWVEKLGFKPKDKVKVYASNGLIILKLIENV